MPQFTDKTLWEALSEYELDGRPVICLHQKPARAFYVYSLETNAKALILVGDPAPVPRVAEKPS
jgi:hypothetical protein